MVSNTERNVKRFNEKCKRNYITIITVHGISMRDRNGEWKVTFSSQRATIDRDGEKTLYVNCLIKKKKKKKKKIYLNVNNEKIYKQVPI